MKQRFKTSGFDPAGSATIFGRQDVQEGKFWRSDDFAGCVCVLVGVLTVSLMSSVLESVPGLKEEEESHPSLPDFPHPPNQLSLSSTKECFHTDSWAAEIRASIYRLDQLLKLA